MKKTALLLLIPLGITLFACQDSSETVIDANDTNSSPNVYQPDQRALAIDQWMEKVDHLMELRIYSTLEYMNGDHELYQVEAYKDTMDTNFVKLVEFTTSKLTGTLQSTSFYYQDGKKVATRELKEEGSEADLHFVERITYYGDQEESLVTKQRTAEYEEQLEDAAFEVGKAVEVSETKAVRALEQTGEFAPLFEGFVEGEGDLYIVVGENKPNGYTSALLVQSLNGLIGRMYKDPENFKGKELSIAFSKEFSPDGDYQLLYGASLVE